jgi:spore germination protein GerM
VIRASLVASVISLAAVALGACGVPLDDAPRAIDRTTTTQTSAVPPAGPTGETMAVFFFRGDRLTEVDVAADDDPTIDDAVKAVLAGAQSPYTTFIPAGTDLLGFRLDGNTAVIDLSDDIEGVGGSRQKGAFAQLVFTALASGDATSVRFKVAGKAVPAPTDNGNVELVVADDYDPPLNPG